THAQTFLPTDSGFNYQQNVGWLSLLSNKVFETNSTVVSNGALGFWVQCLDANGNPIPQLSKSDTRAKPLSFNSSAHFQVAPPGTKFEDGTTFHYTASTEMAQSLPNSVRVVFLLTDEQTIRRFAERIPPIPANTLPLDLDNINRYSSSLAAQGIQTRI